MCVRGMCARVRVRVYMPAVGLLSHAVFFSLMFRLLIIIIF